MAETYVSAKHKIVGVPALDGVIGLFPNAQRMSFQGTDYALVSHDETAAYLLRKMGFTIPAPILTQYEFPHPPGKPPFDVQRQTCAMLSMNERAYVLNEMGTGKTKCPLWAWDHLRKQGRIGKLLIVATLSTLKFTWGREIFETLPEVKYKVIHGATPAARKKMLSDPETEIFIINHDGIKSVMKELATHPEIDAIVVDELAVFRNKSDRTLAMQKIASNMKWVWGMTGSPMPNEPTDVFHQAKIVTPGNVPTYFSHLRDSLMIKVNNFKYVPKQDAVERAYDIMQPAVRFTLDEVVELPECIERWVDVDLGTLQGKVYKDLVQHCQASVGSGLITAQNAGAVMSKLLQVSIGWVYNKDGVTVPLDNIKRIESMTEAVVGSSRKVLVFVPYKHALQGISDALTGEKIEHAVVSGDTPPNERNTIFNLFQNSTKYKAIAAHPQCLAHGITLTAADTIIWFAPITSLEIYEQANRRIRRVGQKHKQLLLHLQSTPIERKIYRMLKSHQDVQNKFLQLFEEGNEDW